MLVRQLETLRALSSRKRGLTVASLVERTGASRATVYRDLELLQEAGLPIASERINGEVRHRLLGSGQAITLCAEQVAALQLAREFIAPIEGASLVEELDTLLRNLGASRHNTGWFQLADPREGQDAALVKGLDSAIRNGVRIAFSYRGAGDYENAKRMVDPLALRLRRGHLYLVAFDVDRKEFRIFKLARMESDLAVVGDASAHPDYDDEKLFENTVGIWSGEPVDVEIQLQPAKARFVEEWPLSQRQDLRWQTDGSVIVAATVAGSEEVLRWTLSWGAAARILEPTWLADELRTELGAALSRYDREQGVSRS